jgi:tRNA-uridine 2-sulfurtransferase
MTKVVVAMSGGVDSSVAAALLKEQGYDVIGMMLRLWSEPGKEDSNRCCTPDSMAQARRVAAILDIPFYVIDAKDVFQRTVVQYFLDGYARGETPNPCLICNRQIRWTFLLDHALALGADFMATGHYVRKQTTDNFHQLLRAVDRNKDQSYVLHVLNQEKLARALFPVGDYPKPEIRQIAEKYGLPTASRKDSQDLCFLAGEDYRTFLQRNAAEMLRPGQIVTRAGESLGEHNGLANYTIGQRKGLGVASAVPLYVLGKNAATNSLIIGTQEELGSSELTARDVNWVSGEEPHAEPFRAEVKIRYTAKEAWALVTPLDGGQVKVQFDAPQRDITAGQAAVFFQNDVVLGGGIIL